MKKTIAVLGLGRFGLGLVQELNKLNVDIIAIDINGANVQKAGEFVENAFICDSTDEDALREIGIENVDHAVVAFGSNFQASLITVITLKEMGVEKITVRIDDEKYASVMQRIGATDIIVPQKIAGIQLANKLVSDSFTNYFNLSEDYVVVQLSVNMTIQPINLKTLNSRNVFGINLLLIKRENKYFSPTGDDSILPGDEIFVLGTKKNIHKFDEYINERV
ncbi:MAG TPA: TrkA family potassium uptake protein [Acholeplasma sp.]|jgi:trk system potassium uptake protein TrkA|nr:TrkA family potassium uptake protein [Acholeplasma sp.]